MKAAYLTGLRQIEIADAPMPKLQRDDDVLIRVAAVGVCGSDMHYYRAGRIGRAVVKYPWGIGHECAGTIEQVGPTAGEGKEKLSIGDRVAIDPLIACGQCAQCLSGREHTCLDQVFMGCPDQIPGALAEYVVMPARCCHRVDDRLTMTQAVMVEPLSIGLYAAEVLSGSPAGKTAAVLGSGPIGLCVLKSLKQAGAGLTAVTDIRQWRRELAARSGADWTGDPRAEDIVAAVNAMSEGGVDMAFECAGEQETIDQCAEVLKPGGLMVLVGIAEADRVSFPADHMRRKELRICNVRRQNKCVTRTIDLIASGQIDIDPLVTHNFSFTQTPEAFEMVADYRDNVVKAIIHMEK